MIDQDRIAELNEPLLADHDRDLAQLAARIGRGGRSDPEAVVSTLAGFSVAAPSWALGTGGTGFGRFPIGGEPRTTVEKIDDVAALRALMGATRSISLHVPWDNPADPAGLHAHALGEAIPSQPMT